MYFRISPNCTETPAICGQKWRPYLIRALWSVLTLWATSTITSHIINRENTTYIFKHLVSLSVHLWGETVNLLEFTKSTTNIYKEKTKDVQSLSTEANIFFRWLNCKHFPFGIHFRRHLKGDLFPECVERLISKITFLTLGTQNDESLVKSWPTLQNAVGKVTF